MKDSSAILDSLNSAQQQAVKTTDGQLLILAGAGSGKTRVITHKIAYLINNNYAAPWEILAVTFTNKAAEEMLNRVVPFLKDKKGLWIGTFHSIFARILRFEAEKLKLTSNFVIYDTEDKKKLIKNIIEDLTFDKNQFPLNAICSSISKLKNQLIDQRDYEDMIKTPFEQVVFQVYTEYQKRTKQNNACDFDDLITIPIKLFKTNPDVLRKYQKKFKYVLVDEYQDTNYAQYKLIHYLSGLHKNVCVVGDDDQSIYGWRGADIRNILEFEKDFPEAKVFRLEQNYRSTKNILKAAHSLVVNNQGRKTKELWCENDQGEKLVALNVYDEHDESDTVVEKLTQEVFKNKRSFGDFAILYRTNSQSRALEEGLRRNNIAYVIVGGVRFYERKEVKDILAYLKFISNPKDTLSLLRIINFPNRGIGNKTIQKLKKWAAKNRISMFDAMNRADEIEEISKKRREKIKEFYKLINKYISLKKEISPNELTHALVDESGILRKYKEDITSDGRERANNIKEFLAAVSDYALHYEKPTLSSFLEQVSLITDIDCWDTKANAVTLMTLHSAKGLEFPIVFITGIEQGLFPISTSLDDPDKLEEERRLFYVGLTRAKERVYLIWAENRRRFRDVEPQEPSMFLDELDPSVLITSSSGAKGQQVKSKKKAMYSTDAKTGYDEFSQEIPSIRPGVKVEHEVYGRGKVVKVSGKGKTQKVVVSFQNGEKKKFLSNYARFTILTE
ncbi:MAG: UvrD-helicase domain-containing protein [bacterium]